MGKQVQEEGWRTTPSGVHTHSPHILQTPEYNLGNRFKGKAESPRGSIKQEHQANLPEGWEG